MLSCVPSDAASRKGLGELGMVLPGQRVKRGPGDVSRLQQIEKRGPAGKTWGGSSDVMAAIGGFAAYVRMVDRAKGDVLVARVRELHRKHGYKPAYPRLAKPKRAPAPAPVAAATAAAPPTGLAADGGKPTTPPDPKKKWWKLW